MIIDDEMLDYVGILAKLNLSDEEKVEAKNDMEKMINYVSKLNELDTSDIEAMSHTFDVENVFREDEITNSNDKEAMLGNAPLCKDGCYLVPKTI